MSLEQLYQELILDHARAPHGRGLDGEPGAGEAESRQYNPVCGDEVTVRVAVDGDRVRAVAWDGHGCAISQASASMLAVLVPGEEPVSVPEARERIDEFREVLRSRGALSLDEERFGDAAALGGVARYAQRVKCAMLAWVALEDALGRAGSPGA